MKVVIAYDSKTGNTRLAAEGMGKIVRAAGLECAVLSVRECDPAKATAAGAICVGSRPEGFPFLVQKPTKEILNLLNSLGDLGGKPAAVFCTHSGAALTLLPAMADKLKARGANVTGRFKSNGPKVPEGFADWVKSLSMISEKASV